MGLGLTAVSLAGAAPQAGAVPSGQSWYAYPAGGAVSPTSCPQTATVALECTLTEALALAGQDSGDTVYLAVASNGTTASWYVGNFDVTSSATIAPAPGLSGTPTLDGGSGYAHSLNTSIPAAACPASQANDCTGPVLTIAAGATVAIDDVTIQDGQNSKGDLGGGIENDGYLTVGSADLQYNTASSGGGAIDNGALFETHSAATTPPSLSVVSSTFYANVSASGGAIDNAQGAQVQGVRSNNLALTVSVSHSTFTGNYGTDGGAIDNGEESGLGSVSVVDSSFDDNTAANHGGAICNADNGSNFSLSAVASYSTVSVTGSTFDGNSAGSAGTGGAIDNADGGSGAAFVDESTFYDNSAGFGGAVSNAWSDNGNLTIVASTFADNKAEQASGPNGAGAIDIQNAYNHTADGAVWLAADVFADAVSGYLDCSQNGLGTQGKGTATWNDEGYNVAADPSCFVDPQAAGDQSSTSLPFEVSGLLPNPGVGGGVAPTETIAPIAAPNGITNPIIGAIASPPSSSNVTVSVQDGSNAADSIVLCVGSSSTSSNPPDQRGVSEPKGDDCDAGSVQDLAALFAFTDGLTVAGTFCNDQGETTNGLDATGCSLTEALVEAGANDVVELATPNTTANYDGNYVVDSTGTSASAPVTIVPAPGSAYPELSGTGTSGAPVLTIDSGVTAEVLGNQSGVYIANGSNLGVGGDGGGIDDQGNLMLVTATIQADQASSGGGIYVGGSEANPASLTAVDVHFYNDDAGNGGAIDLGDGTTYSTVNLQGVNFGGENETDSATSGNGGAIDAGDDGGGGSLTLGGIKADGYNVFNGDTAKGNGGAISVSGSAQVTASMTTYWANSAGGEGGAVALAGNASGTISQSFFFDDSAPDGGAVDNAGSATTTLESSSFMYNHATDGGAVENGATMTLTSSTFTDDGATAVGPAFDNGTPGGSPSAIVAADVFDESCSGVGWNDEGYNVTRDSSCSFGNSSDRDAGSALDDEVGPYPPAGYGASIENVPLLWPNPGIGLIPAGTTNAAGSLCPTTDETGTTTPGGAPCDAGAVQTVATAANGTGTIAVSPTSVDTSSTTTFTFTYTAADLGVYGGELEIAVPSGFSAPTPAAGAGNVSDSCPNASVSVSGTTILVQGFDLAGNSSAGPSSCTITYSTATAPSSAGSYVFATSERSGTLGSPAALAHPPVVAVTTPSSSGGGGGSSGGGSSSGSSSTTTSSSSGSGSGTPQGPGVVPPKLHPAQLLAYLTTWKVKGKKGTTTFRFACKFQSCVTTAGLYYPKATTVTKTVTVKVKRGKKVVKEHKQEKVTVTDLLPLGSAKISLQAGAGKVRAIALNKLGRQLVKSASTAHRLHIDIIWTLPGQKRHLQKLQLPLPKPKKPTVTKNTKKNGSKTKGSGTKS
ncbi:MAG TPA: hypothetical protein VMD59_15415, partial [Acidimicrobiales bacterium]|nr:hypothetical protein [Acidimicrobiales bacterium]